MLDRRIEPRPEPTVAQPRLRIVEQATTSDLTRAEYIVAVAGAILVGFLVRAVFVFATDFPLNDGGMFYAMVRDIQASGYHLPAFTSYNGGQIPFAYPPLAFYIAAALNDLTPLSLTTIFRFMPLTADTLLIGAFFLLARDMLPSRRAVAAAVLFFAMLPATFSWMIMGGGLTRSLGFLFAVLFIREIRRAYLTPSWSLVVAASVCGALAVVSHIEMGLLACLSGAVFFVAYGRNRTGVMHSAVIGCLTGLLTAPWWLTVLVQHGTGPFLASFGSVHSSPWSPLPYLTSWEISGEPAFALTGALALLGIVTCIVRRQYLLPLWILAIAFGDQRGYVTSGTLPLAMVASLGLVSVVLPAAAGTHGILATDAGPAARKFRSVAPRALPAIVLVVIVAFTCVSALATSPRLFQSLTPGERAAMAWARANTAPSSSFIVVTGTTWPIDRNGEWFPVLAARHESIIVQGSEWMPDDGFDRAKHDSATLQQCANSDADCLAAWSANTGRTFDYVYVATALDGARTVPTAGRTCCDGLRAALRHDPGYKLVYDGAGATIFQRVAAQ